MDQADAIVAGTGLARREPGIASFRLITPWRSQAGTHFWSLGGLIGTTRQKLAEVQTEHERLNQLTG